MPKYVRLEKFIEELYEKEGIQFDTKLEHNDVYVSNLMEGKLGTNACMLSDLNIGGRTKEGAVGFIIEGDSNGPSLLQSSMHLSQLFSGFNAVSLGLSSFHQSIQHAKDLQIVENNIYTKRKLLQQKCVVEGSLALCTYVAYLLDVVSHDTNNNSGQRDEYSAVLAFLISLTKNWVSEQCFQSNCIAMQTFGLQSYGNKLPFQQNLKYVNFVPKTK